LPVQSLTTKTDRLKCRLVVLTFVCVIFDRFIAGALL
jgi:hypothetical protein